MKIILNSFGVMQDKRFLRAIDGMSELEWRMNEDVIALIEKRQREIRYLIDLSNKGKATDSQVSRINKLTGFPNDWLYFRIKEVDTSRRWCIADYDSSKSIQYLNEVDESLNFYGFV